MSGLVETNVVTKEEAKLTEILIGLNVPNADLTQKVIEQARGHREVLASPLLEVIASSTECPDDGEINDLYWRALFLLAEWRDRRLVPVMLDILKLPSDDVEQLYCDMLTEEFDCILADIVEPDDYPALEEILNDSSFYEFSRNVIASALDIRVKHGRMPRDQAIAILHNALKKAIQVEDSSCMVGLLSSELDHMLAYEALPDIEAAFTANLIEAFDLQRKQLFMLKPREEAERELAKYPPRPIGIPDAWTKISKYLQTSNHDASDTNHSVSKPPNLLSVAEGFFTDDEKKLLDEINQEWSERPQTNASKYVPGRNDPCLCGSGKKYKKCCGRFK